MQIHRVIEKNLQNVYLLEKINKVARLHYNRSVCLQVY
jgi:hypothetical protein